MNIEPLESRIAPAAAFVSSTTATYTDVDGDDVTVKFSKPLLTPGNVGTVLVTMAGGIGDQLQLIDLTGVGGAIAPEGTNIIVTAKRNATNGGDGFANVGHIGAGGIDLGAVTIAGDLGQIDAGNATTLKSPGVKSLTVQSMGEFGTSTQMGGNLESAIQGALGSLTVKGNLRDAEIEVTAATAADATISKITIGGSLIGGAAMNSGRISAEGDIGAVKIGGSVVGGAGDHSALIRSDGKIGAVTISGSLVGGGAAVMGELDAGRISSGGDMGTVKIGGDVRGGLGELSGTIFVGGTLKSLTIGGSLIGGAGDRSAQIYSATNIGSVTVGGTITGGAGEDSGAIHSEGALGSVTVKGDILGGAGMRSGRVDAVGAVKSFTLGGSLVGGGATNAGHIAGASLDSVKVGGSIIGTGEFGTGFIESLGALKSITVGGSLIGGTAIDTGLIEAGGDLGKVKIVGDIRGGDAAGMVTLFCSGMVSSAGRIGSLFVGGSIISGVDMSTGNVTNNGAVAAGDDIGSLTVKGSLVGNETRTVVISARGQAAPKGTKDVAMGSVNIGGGVTYAQVLAGYDNNGTDVMESNANAQIGSVKVGLDWMASSLVAGVKNRGANNTDDGGFMDDNLKFGDGRDQKIAEAADAITSKIASITIKGQALGTLAAGDHFGILAQQIGSLKIGAVKYPLGKNVDDDQLIPLGATGDFVIDEVPA